MNAPFTPTPILYHHDPNLEARALKVQRAQQAGHILLANSSDGSALGLPSLDRIENLRYERTADGYAYVCPEGKAVYVPELTLYRFIPNNGALPKNVTRQPLELVTAHLDMVKNRAIIQNRGTTITLEEVPTWANPYELCHQLNHELHQNHHLPLLITKLTYDGKPDPAEKALFGGHKVTFSTDHVRATMSGYALDRNLDEHGIYRIVYAGTIGYKTLMESVRATLQASRRQKKFVRLGSRQGVARTCLPHPDQYQTFYASLPNVNAHHFAAVVRTALPGGWQYGDLNAYLLRFEGDDQPMAHKLLDKLTEATTLPLLKEWADALWSAAEKDPELVVELETDGDCLAGYWINLHQELWEKFIQIQLALNTISL